MVCLGARCSHVLLMVLDYFVSSMTIIKIGLNEGKLNIDTNRDYNNPSIRIYLFQVKIENINNKK